LELFLVLDLVFQPGKKAEMPINFAGYFESNWVFNISKFIAGFVVRDCVFSR